MKEYEEVKLKIIAIFLNNSYSKDGIIATCKEIIEALTEFDDEVK